MQFINPVAFLAVVFVVVAFWCIVKQKQNEPITKQTKLLFFAVIALLIAFARPVIQNDELKQEYDSKEFIFALDISYSMMADDLKPDRYTVAKDQIQTVLEHIPLDRCSVFVFTSNALLIAPPTFDKELCLASLDGIDPSYILTKSTSIKTLLETIAKMNHHPKEVILFSDGGEEKDLNMLAEIAKQNRIKLNIVAVGTKKGAVLKKANKVLTDANNNLVISRINPILEPLAKATGGFYMVLEDHDQTRSIIKELQSQRTKKIEQNTHNYTELYWIFVVVAFLLVMIAYTKLFHFIPVLLLFITPTLKASDGYDYFYDKKYLKSAQAFLALDPSPQSYYNAAVAFYKAKRYKKALSLFSSIKTPDTTLKAKIFYNMANAAVMLKRYSRAKVLYAKALALAPKDKEAKENLITLYKYHLKDGVDVADMMPHINDKSSTTTSASNEQKRSSKRSQRKSSASKSSAFMQNATMQTQEKKDQTKHQVRKKQSIQFGYGAYELINKGYINETKPW